MRYPLWVNAPAGHPGHPDHPGKILVESQEQEDALAESGEIPLHLNPGCVADEPVEPKALEEMALGELANTFAFEMVKAGASEDDLRAAIVNLRDGGLPFVGGIDADNGDAGEAQPRRRGRPPREAQA